MWLAHAGPDTEAPPVDFATRMVAAVFQGQRPSAGFDTSIIGARVEGGVLAVQVVEHILREHGPDTEILFGPDMFLGAYVEKVTGRPMHVWDGECHVHAGIRPRDISAMRSAQVTRRSG